MTGFEISNEKKLDTANGASRRSFVSRDELKYFPRQGLVSQSVASMSMRSRASFNLFETSKKSFMGANAAVTSTASFSGGRSMMSGRGSFSSSKTSVSKFVNNQATKTEDAELGLYLLRIVEQFRSIEKKIFKRFRHELLYKEKMEDEYNQKLLEHYEEV